MQHTSTVRPCMLQLMIALPCTDNTLCSWCTYIHAQSNTHVLSILLRTNKVRSNKVTEIPTIIDPSATINYLSATWPIIVGILVMCMNSSSYMHIYAKLSMYASMHSRLGQIHFRPWLHNETLTRGLCKITNSALDTSQHLDKINTPWPCVTVTANEVHGKQAMCQLRRDRDRDRDRDWLKLSIWHVTCTHAHSRDRRLDRDGGTLTVAWPWPAPWHWADVSHMRYWIPHNRSYMGAFIG